MNQLFHTFATFTLAVLCWPALLAGQQIELYFSPNGGAAHAVATEISNAKKSVKVMAYSISEPEITAALVTAQQRGVAVGLIVNPNQQNDLYSSAGEIKRAKAHTIVDHVHKLQHNKTMVIDDIVVITGSMNFTRAGDKNNAENTLVIHDAAIAARYAADWQTHFNHSIPFVPIHSSKFSPPPTPPPVSIPKTPARKKDS